MKKVFYFLTVAILALGVVSCKKNNQQQEVTYDYSLELSAIYDENVKAPYVNAKLSEEGVAFVLAPFTTEELVAATEADVFTALMTAYGENIDAVVHTKSGQYSFPYMSWEPETSYTIVGFVVNTATLAQLSKMASAEVFVPATSKNEIKLQYDNDSSIFVSASNNDPYYIAFTSDSVYTKYIASGAFSVSQYVAQALIAGVEASKKVHPDFSYSEVADLYLLSGSMKYNFVEEYADFPKGAYYALACGIEFTDNEVSFTAQPTTKGVAVRFELDKDYILSSEVRAQLRGMNTPLKAVRTLDFKIDRQKMMMSVRVD